MRKIILLIISILFTFFISACNTREEDKMELSKINNEKEKTQKEFTAFISKDGERLLELIYKLNSKEGYFYMDIDDSEISVDTNKGKEFEEASEFVKSLSIIMEENNFDQLVQEESNKDIIFFRTVRKSNIFAMHRLIYHKGELDPETQHDYKKIANDFYYSYSVGE